MEDLYATLDCNCTSSQNVIKENYQRLLLKHHPDKRQSIENKDEADVNLAIFQKIQQAYKILGIVYFVICLR